MKVDSFPVQFPKEGKKAVLSFVVLDSERKQQPRPAAGQALINDKRIERVFCFCIESERDV